MVSGADTAYVVSPLPGRVCWLVKWMWLGSPVRISMSVSWVSFMYMKKPGIDHQCLGISQIKFGNIP